MVSVVLAPMVAGSMFVILSRAGVEGGWWSANGDHGFPSKLRASTRSTGWGQDPLPKGGPLRGRRRGGGGGGGSGGGWGGGVGGAGRGGRPPASRRPLRPAATSVIR